MARTRPASYRLSAVRAHPRRPLRLEPLEDRANPDGGTVFGTLYLDVNGNGTIEFGDLGAAGVTVFLDANANGTRDPGEESAVTNFGSYQLSADVDGTYRVTVVPSAGYARAAPVSIDLTGDVGLERDIAVDPTSGGIVRGTLFLDANGNRTRDAGEGRPAEGDFAVYLDANGNQVYDQDEIGAQVAADGSYAFFRTADGPARVRWTDRGQGGFGGAFDRAFALTTDDPGTVDLSGGAVLAGTDFGVRYVTGVRGEVFDDLDADGQRDFGPAEPGRAGVTVYADLNDNRAQDGGEPAAVTGADGSYLLDVGTAGSYFVRVAVPGLVVTTREDDFPASVPADRTAGGPQFGVFAVAGTISGRVVLDANRNGAVDPGERGGAVRVFADGNGNGLPDPGEPTAAGDDRFDAPTPGAFTLLIPAANPGDYVVRLVPFPGLVAGLVGGAVTVGGGNAVTLAAPISYTRTGGTATGRIGITGTPGGTPDRFVDARVYVDLNGNDAFDPDEPNDLTDGGYNGSAGFSIPLPADGRYTLRVVPPAGYAVAGRTDIPIFLAAGGQVNVGFNLRRTAGGYVTVSTFYDANANGTADPGEPAGLPGGPTAYLDVNTNGTFDAGTDITANAGVIATPAVDGPYAVRLTLPPGQVATRTLPIAVDVSGGTATDAGAVGYRLTVGGVVTGSVFDDANGNGTRDAGEFAGSFTTVYDDANDNGTQDDGELSTFTQGDGTFALYLPTDGQSVRLRVAADLAPATVTTPPPAPVTVTGGSLAAVPAFGVQRKTFFDGQVFDDRDGDGDRAAGEPVLGGVTVYADLNGDGVRQTGEPSAVSGVGGDYRLELPGGGTYTVRAVTAAGQVQTAADPRDAFAGSSNPGPAVGLLTAPAGTVTGAVFRDFFDGDGVPDAPADNAQAYLDVNGNAALDDGEPVGGVDFFDGTFRILVPADRAGTHPVRVTGGYQVIGPLPSATVGGGNAVALGTILVRDPAAPAGGQVPVSAFIDVNGDGTRDPLDLFFTDPGVTSLVVYADLNDNGTPDAGEPTEDLRRVISYYALNFPANGTFKVRAVTPAGYARTGPDFQSVTFPGSNFSGLAFGFRPTAGGFATGSVYYDADADGTRDPGEVVFDGATVTLGGAGEADGAGGFVLASPAADGTYTVRAGVRYRGSNSRGLGTVTNIDPVYVPLAGGAAAAAPVAVGVLAVTGGLVTGTVYADADRSGTRDPGEGGIPAGTVVVYDDANGNGSLDLDEEYGPVGADGSFAFLVAGDGPHRLRVKAGSGPFGDGGRAFALTSAPPADFDLAGGAVRGGLEFGGRLLTVLDGTVFDDRNGNGQRDFAAESGLAGVTAYADLNGNGALDGGEPSAVTSGFGFYRLDVGTGGEYTVRVVPPEGRTPTTAPAPRSAETDFVRSGGDFGLVGGFGTVSGTVFYDTDADGNLDLGEFGLAGATVFLDANGNSSADPAEARATTAADGAFQIAAPAAGTFPLRVVPPAGATATTANPLTVTVGGGSNPTGLVFGVNVPAVVNTAPTLAGLPAGVVAVAPGGVPAPIPFTVGDAQTAAGDLTVTVTAAGGAGFTATVSGTGAARTLTFAGGAGAPAGSLTDFTVTVADAGGLTTQARFTVGVQGAAIAPPVSLVGTPLFAVGADEGGGSLTVHNPDGSVKFTTTPFPGAAGGVRTTTADFNGDGTVDVVAGTGPGGPARIVVIDPTTGATLFSKDLFDGFTGGVFVSAGDIDGDGKAELFVTPDEGGGPRVAMFAGGTYAEAPNFFGIDDPNFRGGARTAVGDVNGDGVPDLVVAAGFGGGPRVAVFDGAALRRGERVRLFGDVLVFEDALRNGVYVTVGDLDGDGRGDLIAGGGPGGGPRVLALSGADLLAGKAGESQVLANFFGGDVSNRAGIRLAVKNLDGDNRADLVVGPGEGAGGKVTAYLGKNVTASTSPSAFDLDALAGLTNGVFVG